MIQDTSTIVLNTTTTTTTIKEKMTSEQIANDLVIRFLGINYDANFGSDAEEELIKKSGFKFCRSVLTLSNFEDILIESPPIVHISTHGTHQYQNMNKPDEFQIALEEKQILRYLIDEHKYSAYYAAVAILFEEEMNNFVQYGIKHRHPSNPNNKGLKLCIAKDNKIFTLLQDANVYGIFQCIMDRFGCYYRENTIIGCIEICWGRYEYKGNDIVFIPPHSPIDVYQFSQLYGNDTNVQQIYKEITDKYNQSVQNIQMRKHQKFNWKILSKILQQKLNIFNMKPCDIDYANEERKSDKSDDYIYEAMETKIKYNKIMEYTRELKIIPLNINRHDLENDTEALKKLIKTVSDFKTKVVTRLKQAALISIRLEFSSETAKNVHIIRFDNKYALSEACKEINKIKEQIDVHHDYDIQFRQISKADDDTKKQVGFMQLMQEKLYFVDIKNKSDPISTMIEKHLKSKKECKIKLLILNGCHSYILGKIFSQYIPNVICIHPFVKIWASTATNFAKRFYQSLKRYTVHENMEFSRAVLKSFNVTKKNIAKQCSNDYRCVSHSHSHPFCNQLHLNGNWKELQHHINDRGKFVKYRKEMNKCVVLNEPMANLYDEKSLLIANISAQKMDELYEYLETEYDVKNNNDETFITNVVYRPNKYYQDFNVAFFKFGSENMRNIAMKMLSQKQYNETLILSQQMLLNGDIHGYDLGWNYRIIPRCCCSPEHPHMVEDKFILLQNGHMINRSIIDNIAQIKAGLNLKQLKQSKQIHSKSKNEMNNSNNSNNKEKETKQLQRELAPKQRQQKTFQNDAYFGTFKQRPKRNDFSDKL